VLCVATPGLDDSEAELVRRIAAGDRSAALAELYDRYGARLYGLGVRLFGDRGLAEELVQETFVRVWRASTGFDDRRGTVRAWLFTIARRTAVDLHRRRPGARERLDAEPPELGAPDDRFDALLLEAAVRDAIATLTPEHRQAIELAYRHELTQSEIAERLGLPLGTVKSRTFAALRALRTALDGQGFDA
jgi:RNA polymerase sigma-70 factor (ECF subfamily)